MATSFPVGIWGSYRDDVQTRDYIVDSAATFKKGEFVYWDTSSKSLKGCGSDPSLVAGIVGSSAAFALGTEFPGPILPGSRTPVELLSSDILLFMASTTTPLKDHIGTKYGITKDSNNNWLLDTSKTGGTARALVVDIYNAPSTTQTPGPQTGQEGYVVRLGSTYLQFCSIF